eukprot:Clim_evm19s191 gene=Clim_evmTU19s191
MTESRTHWDNRWQYILAAMGSAIGLGNVWRFPFMAYEYGGGAFFIPYILALIFLGIPLFVYEASLGQCTQAGPALSLMKLHRRGAGVGIGLALGAGMIVTYYTAIMNWSWVYFVESFYADLPWYSAELDAPGNNSTSSVLQYAEDHYNDVVMQAEDPGHTEIMVSALYGANVMTFACIYFAIWKGVKVTGKVVYFTVLAPIMSLFVLVIRGATLDGAEEGIKEYIGRWDLSELSNGEMWSSACSQIFFSLSLAHATMIAYGSYNPAGGPVVENSLIVCFGNSAFSFFAGFAVFSTLGYFAVQEGVPISEVSSGGKSLAFVAFPVTLAKLPAANFFSALFFLTLILLGIDSAFANTEAVITTLDDMRLLQGQRHEVKTLIVVAVMFLLSAMYSSDVGTYLLDVADHFINQYAMLLLGAAEVIVGCWMYQHDELVEEVGAKAVKSFEAAFFGSVGLGLLAATVAWNDLGSLATILGFAIGLPILVIGTWMACRFGAAYSGKSWGSVLESLTWHQPEHLRNMMNAVITQNDTNSNTKIPKVQSFWLKFVIPAFVWLLLLIAIRERANAGPYDGLPVFYQILGVGVIVAILGSVVIFAVFPELMENRLEDGDLAWGSNVQSVMAAAKKEESPFSLQKKDVVSADLYTAPESAAVVSRPSDESIYDSSSGE